MFVGVAEIKAMMKGGGLLKNLPSKLRQIRARLKNMPKEVKEQLAKRSEQRLSKKLFTKYSTVIDNSVKQIPRKKINLKSIKNSFKNGYYRTVKTIKPIKVYRDFGEGAMANSIFTTTNKFATRESSAIRSMWKNSMRYKAEIEVPVGTELQIGKIGEQPFKSKLPEFKGGDDQILLPDNYDVKWIKKVIDTETGQVFSGENFYKKFHKTLYKNY